MDWKSYIQADLSNLADDEQKVEQIYNFLQENNLPRDVDSVDFRAIFKNTMTVMRFYASRTNAYFEELVKRERDEPRSEEDKEELIHLREELKEKENTIRDLRAAGSGHAMSEVRELREENSDLRRTVDRMKRQAETARDDIQSLSDDLQQARGKVRELERERDTLLQDISDYKRQIQWQSHNSTSGANTGGTGYYRDLLRDKDRKLDKTLDEVERLVTANASMEGELGSLTVKLQQVEQGRAELANQMSALRTALKESDLKCDDYESKTKMMNDRIEDLTGNLKKARKSDEEIAAILDRQQKEWEVNDKRKEEELNRLRKKVSQLEQQLRMVGADKDKKTVSKLTKTLKEREEELRDLGEQLDRAVKHIEALTAELELSKNKRDMIAGGEGGSNGSKQLTVKVLQLEEMLKHEREQRIQVEREKASVEEEMLRLSRRVRDYETGDFGLSEAVEEIKKRKVEVSVRDEQLRKRTEEVNSLNNDLDTVCEENEVLRRRLGLSNEEEIDIKDIKHRKNVEIERLRAVNRELEKQVSRLEEDRVDLRQQLLLEAKKRAERSVELGLTTDSLVSVEDYAERLRASSRQRSPELQRDQNNSSLAKELTSAKKSLEKYKNECKRLRAELKESSSLNDERLTALQNMTSQVEYLVLCVQNCVFLVKCL
jgi:centrosomal protein CEP290